jgi:hypothetical protein
MKVAKTLRWFIALTIASAAGGATADDVLRLAVRIKREVAERFGVFLRPEPMFVGFEGDAAAAYLLRHGTE